MNRLRKIIFFVNQNIFETFEGKMEYLEKMKAIQNAILEYLDDESGENSNELIELLNDQKNRKDIYELKSILYLISKICQNHHRGPLFIDKVKLLINTLKADITQNFSNTEIFKIFEENKRILLLLIDENILAVDRDIFDKISIYEDYFYPEIQKFNQSTSEKELPDDFEEKRRIGENDQYVCQLIRNDNVDDFIISYNKQLFSLTDRISQSIYETNSYLIDKEPTLIEYSLFFGSIQILRFLRQNGIEFLPSSWIYAIHGKNPLIIHLIEEEKVLPVGQTYEQCFNESIKCHHNDFASYFKDNFLNENVDQNDKKNQNKKNHDDENKLKYLYDHVFYEFQYYNFAFISKDLIEPIYFYYAVDFDYFKLVDYIKNKTELDVNQLIILC